MSIIYSKQIASMICVTQADGLSDIVYKINWSLSGTEGPHIASQVVITDVPAPSGTFIPYSDLTEQQVMSWIDTYTPADTLTAAQTAIAEQLLAITNTNSPPLPWAV